MRNSECGIAGRGSNPTLRFRIPHSTFSISLFCLPPLPSPNNQFRRRLLLVPCLLPLDLAPGICRGPTARGFALAAAQRVVDRVHRHAAHPRIPAQPAALPGLPDREQLVLGIAHLADRRKALAAHHPHFGGAEAQRDVVAFLRHHLDTGACRAGQLASTPDLELHVVYRGAERDLEQGHGVPDPDVRARTGDDRIADGEALGGQDVALLAVRVVQQRDARRPVRVVLDRRHLGGDAELLPPEVDPPIAALVPPALPRPPRGGDATLPPREVDPPIAALVPPALPPVGDVALVVAAARASQRLEQRLFGLALRDVGEVGDRAEARARRHRSKLSNAHISPRTRRSRRLL